MMRSFLSLASFFAAGALASHLGPVSDDYRDYVWSYSAEDTADELKEQGLPLPELAAPITTVHDQESYVVKLECLGCPFRVREYGEVVEYWEETPQDNSLLFNISVGADKQSLLINGKQFEPLVLPAPIYAFQTPANLSAETMHKMVDMRMMDESWNVGTKYGHFEISFEHTAMMTAERGIELLQFVVTHAEIRSGSNTGGAALNQPHQKLIQMKLSREKMGAQLKIKSIELVEQGEKMTSTIMPCGKHTSGFTQIFRAPEWDYYGHIGTWSRTLNMIFSEGGEWIVAHIPHLALLALIAGLVTLRCRFVQRRSSKKSMEDPEAVYLIVENDDEDDEDIIPESVHEESPVAAEEKLLGAEDTSNDTTLAETETFLAEEEKNESMQ